MPPKRKKSMNKITGVSILKKPKPSFENEKLEITIASDDEDENGNSGNIENSNPVNDYVDDILKDYDDANIDEDLDQPAGPELDPKTGEFHDSKPEIEILDVKIGTPKLKIEAVNTKIEATKVKIEPKVVKPEDIEPEPTKKDENDIEIVNVKIAEKKPNIILKPNIPTRVVKMIKIASMNNVPIAPKIEPKKTTPMANGQKMIPIGQVSRQG